MRGRLATWALGLLAAAAPVTAAAAPCAAPFPLRESHPLLGPALDRGLRAAGLGRALDARRLTVSLVDLTRGGEPAYAGIHDDVMLYAASLPKIAILLALFEGVERGDVAWEDGFRWKVDRMINVSSNPLATWAGRQVGLKGIARVMRDPRYCFYEPGTGGLWAGRYFEKGGPSHREPLRQLSHAATARQAARFYVLLDRGLLVSPYWSRAMRRLMSPPGYRHKFVGALASRPGLRFAARKSGTWRTYHADSALIQHGHARYVLTALADHPDGESMLRRVARVADDLVVAGRHRGWVGRRSGAPAIQREGGP